MWLFLRVFSGFLLYTEFKNSASYKQCCDKHWGARVSLNSGFLGVYAQQWECWVIWQFCFQHSVFLHSESPQDAQLGVVAVADNFLDCCIFCLLMWQVTFSICSHTRVLRI